MISGKEIRNKIASVQSTMKITQAMEMVARFKMAKAQKRMSAGRPYVNAIRTMAAHLTCAFPEYRHPYLKSPAVPAQKVGLVVVTTDKGLCGGLNTNLLRQVTAKLQELEQQGQQVELVAIGNKGLGFLNRVGADVVAHAVHLGDAPQFDQMVDPVNVLIKPFFKGQLDAVYLCYTRFIHTMKQEPVVERLLPLPTHQLLQTKKEKKSCSWEYIYDPDAETVIDELMLRYVDALIYQSVLENQASEQSARMMAMKAATNSGNDMLSELKRAYNKARQSAITTELTEIASGGSFG